MGRQQREALQKVFGGITHYERVQRSPHETNRLTANAYPADASAAIRYAWRHWRLVAAAAASMSALH